MKAKIKSKNMMKFNHVLSKVSGLVTLFMAGVFILLLFTHCEKDPIKGWTFYRESPPPPKITSMTSVIKNCEPPYPVTYYQITANNQIGNMVYRWDFGDGTISTEQNPTHIYTTQGNYQVKLTVSNEVGTDTMSLDMPELSLASIPVEAGYSFSHFNNNSFAPNKVIFTNASTGANIFAWTFGDGIEDNDDEPTHIFQNAGTYNVKLKGTCTNGSFDEVTQQIFINPAPQRVFIDSINLMLPSAYKSNSIYIELWHNMTYVGRTVTASPSSYPFKFRRPGDFPGGYFFDYVQFTSNEVFKFLVLEDNGANPPTLIYEILLSSVDIKNNFYPRKYPQIETVPALNDVFIDLYLAY
jgi:PKD repeat protein